MEMPHTATRTNGSDQSEVYNDVLDVAIDVFLHARGTAA